MTVDDLIDALQDFRHLYGGNHEVNSGEEEGLHSNVYAVKPFNIRETLTLQRTCLLITSKVANAESDAE